jgi:hypothetical protein
MTDSVNKDGWKYYELFLLPFTDVHAGAADIGLDYINYLKFDRNYTRILAASSSSGFCPGSIPPPISPPSGRSRY